MTNINDADVSPCVIPFRYPWSKEEQHVPGLQIKRIVDENSASPVLAILDASTPRPDYPIMACVMYSKNRIDDFRFLETTTHIPLI